MANNCSFYMKVTGSKESVDTLIRMMQWKDEFKENGIGRVYTASEIDREEFSNGIISSYITGDCAWSVLTAMRKQYRKDLRNLEDTTKELDLVVEVYSEEIGVGFQEHTLIVKGDVIKEECVEYEEHWLDEYDTVEEYNNEYGTNFTEDMVEDEYIRIGGFGDDYGIFSDHLKYFSVSA